MNAEALKRKAGELAAHGEHYSFNDDQHEEAVAILRAVAGGELATAEKGFRVLTDDPLTCAGRVLVIQGGSE
jgi:hypothetical protein